MRGISKLFKIDYLFLTTLSFLIFVVLSFENSWQHPEAASSIFSSINNIHQFFSIVTTQHGIELIDRTSRPLEPFVRGLDYYFRSFLWYFIPPHPSLSLPVLLILIAVPIFLWKLFVNLKFPNDLRKILLIFYFLSPGTAILASIYFRPAKLMVNFFMAYLFYFTDKTARGMQNNDKHLDQMYPHLLKILFLSFFFDETAVFIYPILFVLYPQLFLHGKKIYPYLLLPVLVYVIDFHFYPFLIKNNHFRPNLMEYHHIVKFKELIPDLLIHPQTHFIGFLKSSQLVIEDLFGINPIREVFEIPLLSPFTILHYFTLGMALLLIGINRKKLEGMKIKKWSLIFLFLFLMHYLMMCLKYQPYGICWYGSFFTIPFVLFLGDLLRPILAYKRFLFVLTFVSFVALAIKYQCTNYSYRTLGPQHTGMFSGKYNRYHKYINGKPAGFNFQKTFATWYELKTAENPKIEDTMKVYPYSYILFESKMYSKLK